MDDYEDTSRATGYYGRDINSLYFGYRPVGWHEPGCPRQDTGLWEVGQHSYVNFDGVLKESTLRFVCTECGAAAFFSTDGMHTEEYTGTGHIGFGSKPQQVMGLWLHAGPALYRGEKHGPSEFYVTRSKDRPASPEDIVAAVAWGLGPRGGIRWAIGFGETQYGLVQSRWGWFSSRRAAVKRVAEVLADQDAAATGSPDQPKEQ